MESKKLTNGSLIRTCSIWRALEVVGDAPILLIIEAYWLGERRFSGFKQRTGLLQALLSARLNRLVDHEIFTKRPCGEDSKRYQYVMTEKGHDLFWVGLSMLHWERRWGQSEGKIKIRLDHRICNGHDIEPIPGCLQCCDPFDARQISWEPGPGAGWMEPHYSTRRRQRSPSKGAISDTTLLDTIIQVAGDRWSGLILRSIFTGYRRYHEIQEDVAIATNILSERLAWLIDIGILYTKAQADAPSRHEYRLTESGIGYFSILVMLLIWGDTWYKSPEGPPLRLFHGDDAHPLQPAMVCSHCQQPLKLGELDVVDTH